LDQYGPTPRSRAYEARLKEKAEREAKEKLSKTEAKPFEPVTKNDIAAVVAKSENKSQWLLLLIAMGMWHPFGWGIAGAGAVAYCIIGYIRGWRC
jgi:hypothetical protein